MDLKSYLDGGFRGDLASAVGVNPVYLRHVALGYRTAGPELALAIERETGGLVTVAELRPELADALRRAGYARERAA